MAGTTRDTLEEHINLQGISLNIIDTAGIRETGDLVEQIGVDKARKQAELADLILYVIDASVPLDESDKEIFELIENKKTILLLNKTDLERVVSRKEIESNEKISKEVKIIEFSAKEQSGVEDLEKRLRICFCRKSCI